MEEAEMVRSRPRYPLASLAAGAAALLAATLPAAAQGQGPVKIGILNDQASVYSSITGEGSVVAARLAIEDIGGSLFGKPVEIVVADHGHKPDVGSAIARRWFDTEGVGAIFDIYSSGVALAVQKVAEDKGKVLVVSMASSGLIGGKQCSPNGMQWANDGYEVAKLTTSGGGEPADNTWFFLTVDYAAGHSIEADATKMITARGGKVLGSARFPLGTPDFSSFSCARSNPGQEDRLHRGRGRHDELDQAGGRVRHPGLGAALRAVLADDGGRLRRRQQGLRRDAGRAQLLLGRERGDEALDGALPEGRRPHAERPPGQRLQRRPALPEGREGVGDDGDERGARQDEGDAGRGLFTKGARVRADGRLMRDVYYARSRRRTR
jgi:branched-chain amino acid transport system substrate-binding protein